MTGYLVVAAAAMLAVVFAVSLATKARGAAAFAEFQDWVRALDAVPDRLVGTVAVAMVVLEATALVLVVVPGTRPGGLLLSAATIACFAASIGWLSRRGVTVGCRCFGTSRRPMGAVEIVRNSVLAAVAAVAGVLALGGTPPLPAGTAVPAVLAGAVAGLVAVRSDDVYQLFAAVPQLPRGKVGRP